MQLFIILAAGGLALMLEPYIVGFFKGFLAAAKEHKCQK
jgi:hypothetical protein